MVDMKKNLIPAVLALVCMAACSQPGSYTVNGKNATDGKTVYLIDKISGETIDSTVVSGGTFTLKGRKHLAEPLLQRRQARHREPGRQQPQRVGPERKAHRL